MVEIYRCPIYREVYAPSFSKATLFAVIFNSCALFIPFLIVYRSGGFWQKDLKYFEQPDVQFLRQGYFEFHSPDGIQTWSTYADLNSQTYESTSLPYMTVKEVDRDGDGLLDQLQLVLYLRSKNRITGLYTVLMFSVAFRKQLYLIMKCPIVLKYDAPSSLPGRRFSLVGSLTLNQNQPLFQGQSYLHYDTLPVKEKGSKVKDFQFKTIQEQLSTRQVFIGIEDDLVLWTPGVSDQDNSFTLNVTVFYSPVLVWSHPSFWQLIWWGWIQYFPVLLLCLYVSDRIKTFVFQHNLFGGCVQKLDPLVLASHKHEHAD